MLLWFKAAHLLFMICWAAGLFYLPRLFVYHALTKDTVGYDRFCLMERKLFWGIMTPSALLTFLFGIGMLHTGGGGTGWLHAKFSLLGLLVLYHVLCGYYWFQFKKHKNTHSSGFYRLFNEIPVLLFAGIIFLAVLKPW
jgi:putative membrane protein